MSDDDDFDDELRELIDLPPWKARQIMQERFNEADTEFRKWQMTSDAFTVEIDKFGPAYAQHFLKHKTTGKVVGWLEGSKTECALFEDGKKAIHFKSEDSSKQFLDERIERKQFAF